MSYPDSPFAKTFHTDILLKLGNDDRRSLTTIERHTLTKILKWLCLAPKITSYRVNILKGDAGGVRESVQTQIEEVLSNHTHIKTEIHQDLPNTVVVRNWGEPPVLERHEREVIVDTICAAAVLRGAHIYAPGVLGMISGTQVGDSVSIFADLAKKCKKGLQRIYEHSKVFVGNGIVNMDRSYLFCDNPCTTGIAIEVKETISNCPPLGDRFLSKGSALLQNLPSIICIAILDPQPNETVLDMCAAPGNKTTDIGARMQNQGRLVAIDKTPTKVAQLKTQCKDFGINADILQADSTKLLEIHSELFLSETYDRILLDAPCSALGKRPQFTNTVSTKVLQSYVPLQRKLFINAAHLLKNGGVLVYSTCTITLAENEGIVAWALKTFNNLELVHALPHFGGFGLTGADLTEDQRKMVQRFGPDQDIDSVGFFIAKFVKRKTSE